MKNLLEHFKSHPKMQIQDLFKFLYQSAFGCEHALSSLDNAIAFIKEEYTAQTDCKIERLDGDYSRVPLGYLSKGLSAETLGKLFFLSAKGEKGDLKEKIQKARELIKSGFLPFELDEFEKELEDWEKKGFPAVHHSDTFREEYRPSYRVVSNDFVPFLELLATVDLRKEKTVVAIEGGSASGKTSLSQLLEKLYNPTIFHTDDFFLQPHQRTPERLNEVGGNLDRERFLKEVLTPLKEGRKVEYRRFDCSTMKICEAEIITPKNLVIIEGAYSMHPDLREFYDLSVFIDISKPLQKERVLNRNPKLVDRFFNEWIPLEERYFDKMQIKENCDMVIEIR